MDHVNLTYRQHMAESKGTVEFGLIMFEYTSKPEVNRNGNLKMCCECDRGSLTPFGGKLPNGKCRTTTTNENARESN